MDGLSVLHKGREGQKEGDRDGGREDHSLLTSRACAFLYLKFDALWSLDNLMLKISPKSTEKSALKVLVVWMGREGERERGRMSLSRVAVHLYM